MRIIGLMSGTSADGIDAVLVEIEGEPPEYRYKLHAHTFSPWKASARNAILKACSNKMPLSEVATLHVSVGKELVEALKALKRTAGFRFEDIDAIASHGQTIWHSEHRNLVGGRRSHATMQIGEPAIIAQETGCLVVSDFRHADMAAEGKGAPLVPFADYALFRSATETRAVQNIGGIANVSYLPKNCALTDVIAFDTGPGNVLLDALATIYTEGRARFDPEGRLAATGKVSKDLLKQQMEHHYFQRKPPKSTGRELFNDHFIAQFRQAARKLNLTAADALATATALTAESISRAYRDFLLPKGAIDTVIVGGGGTKNQTLMRLLAKRLAPARLTTHAEFGLANEAKEAVAFALLAYETLHGRPSNVPSATGALRPAILGKITLPPAGADAWIITRRKTDIR